MTKPITIDIRIGDKRYEADLRKVPGLIDNIGDAAVDTSRDLGKMTKATKTSKVGIDQLGGAVQLLGGVVGTLALKELAVQLTSIADKALQLDARVRLASEGLGDAEQNIQALLAIGGDTGAGFGNMVGLFEKLAIAAEEVGGTNEELLQVTDTVAKLTANVEKSNATASMQQLGQALGGGVVRAEEFNSMLENTPLLLNTVAKSLGMSTGKLRKYMLQGNLTSEMMFNGLLASQAEANRRFEQMPRTVAMASTALTDQFARALNVVNTELGITQSSAGVIDDIAKLIEDLVDTGTLAAFSDEIAAIGVGLASLAGAAAAVGVLKALALVLGTLAGPVGLFAAAAAGAAYFMMNMDELPDSVDGVKDKIAELEAELVSLNEEAEKAPQTVGRLNEIRVDSAEQKIQRVSERLKELRAHMLELESATAGAADLPTGITPPVSVSAGSANNLPPSKFTKVTIPQRKPMALVLPDEETLDLEIARIEKLGEAVDEHLASMQDEADKAAASLQNAWDSFGDGLSQSLASTLLTGENAVDDFLKNIAEKIVQAQIQESIVGPLMGALSGSAAGGDGGWLAGLVGSVFGGGFATGGQMPANRVALVGENGPELIHTGPRGGYVQPNAAGGGAVQVNVTNTGGQQVQATGASAQQTPEGLVIDLVVSDIANGGPVAQSIQQTMDVRARV